MAISRSLLPPFVYLYHYVLKGNIRHCWHIGIVITGYHPDAFNQYEAGDQPAGKGTPHVSDHV
jgi:hypothetical protein